MHQVQLELMHDALSLGNLAPERVWLRYCAIGGQQTAPQVERFLRSDPSQGGPNQGVANQSDPGMTEFERDVLAHAINELLWDQRLASHVPYLLDSTGAARATDGPSISAAAAWLLTEEEAEAERLLSLTASGLLASGPAEALDALVVEARDAFGVSSASVSLIGADHQYLKASVGPLRQLLPRRESFCNEAIRSSEPLVLPDTLGDERFRSHPLVVDEPCLRFYAAYPLRGPGGWNIGTFCILDQRPHGFSAHEREVFHGFARRAQREVRQHPSGGAAPPAAVES
ncbi:GAF domain-containing protein [Arthrobacter sp. TMS1-12-1]